MTADPGAPASVAAGPWPAGEAGRRRVTLPAAGVAARMARQEVRVALARWELGGLEETAVLLVSELASNAVCHARAGGHGIELRLAVTGPSLRIEVADGDPALPQPRVPSGMDESGFGFVLVQALAARWGTAPVPGGKTVWVELDTGPAHASGPGPVPGPAAGNGFGLGVAASLRRLAGKRRGTTLSGCAGGRRRPGIAGALPRLCGRVMGGAGW